MSDSKTKQKTERQIKTRQPQKKTDSGIFANLRNLPHPVEEILGIRSPLPLIQVQEKNETPNKVISESSLETHSLTPTPIHNLVANYNPVVNSNPAVNSNPVANYNHVREEILPLQNFHSDSNTLITSTTKELPNNQSLVRNNLTTQKEQTDTDPLSTISKNENLVVDSNPLANYNPLANSNPEKINDSNFLPTSYSQQNSDTLQTIIATKEVATNNLLANSNPVAKYNPLAMQPGGKIQPGSESLPTSKIQVGSNTLEPSKQPDISASLSGYTPVPNAIFDNLLTQLKPNEQAIWLRLYRLSFGFNKTTCKVGLSALARRTNTSVDTARRTVRELQNKGVIKILQIDNTGTDMGGTEYEIYTSIGEAFNDSQSISAGKLLPTSKLLPASNSLPTSSLPPITDDDHDDLNITDHHQSEHQKTVMTIYKTHTSNNWTKADQKSYEKVKNVPTEKIELAIRLTKERANNRPNSFAYFVKEILAVANPSQQSRNQRKKSLENIVDRVRTNRVGGSSYSISDLAYDVKEICVREGVMFDHDIFNEVISKNKP